MEAFSVSVSTLLCPRVWLSCSCAYVCVSVLEQKLMLGSPSVASDYLLSSIGPCVRLS